MDNNINDNWCISVLVTVIIVLLLIKIYDSLNDSDTAPPTILTQTKNIL